MCANYSGEGGEAIQLTRAECLGVVSDTMWNNTEKRNDPVFPGKPKFSGLIGHNREIYGTKILKLAQFPLKCPDLENSNIRILTRF